jgi:hypothetical protein
MANQQLLEYMQQQLSGKVAKDTIKANLKSQGWSDQDVVEGFEVIERPTSGSVSMWAKGIPRTNNVFMVISLLLVFGLDLLILISSPSLAPYWYMMLGVLAAFVIFYCLENFVFRKRFFGTTSRLDKWISLIIVLRNIIFLLNFVPLIQLLGLALLGGFLSIVPGLFGGNGLGLGGFGIFGLAAPILIISYIILIVSRYSTTKKAT